MADLGINTRNGAVQRLQYGKVGSQQQVTQKGMRAMTCTSAPIPNRHKTDTPESLEQGLAERKCCESPRANSTGPISLCLSPLPPCCKPQE